MKTLEDRFVGCLVGLALGDAMGMPVEGFSAREIDRRFGKITELLPDSRYTDDTNMALCQIESIIRCGRVDPEDTARRFVEWFDSGDIFGIGRASYESIVRLKRGVKWRESGKRGEWAAGNGAAMRIAPVGLFDYAHPERLREDVRAVSMITHNNEEAIGGALAVAYAVAGCVRGEIDLRSLIPETIEFIGPDLAVSENLRRAGELLEAGVSVRSAAEILGTSGYVVHTVATSFYAFLKTPENFEETLVETVNAGGDTDTLGAISGAISGAFNGVGKIPERWLKRVVGADQFARVARRLFEMTQENPK
ncbi:MAG: ADP-ribosylglycohydrolase family protein [bacterium]